MSNQMKTTLPKIGNPATNALANIGVDSLAQLGKYTKDEILALHGMGPKAMGILEEEMKKHGLEFKGD